MLDLLIVNGLIIDGTGSPGYYAAVGVQGDSVRIFRGDLSSVEAARTIDATDHVVCPGFIDVHAHSALMILAEPRHEPKVRQGITTELIGIDGNSYAPFRSHQDLLRFIELNSGLEGNPPLPGRWSTVEQYLAMFDQKVAVNIAYILGNSPVRIDTIGWEDKPATRADLENMKAVIREAMEQGAFGLSTGLDYPPGNYADTDELVDLSTLVAKMGGIYHTHVRYKLGDRFLDPFREALEIGQRSGVPVHVTHFYQRAPSSGGGHRLLRLVEDASEGGQDVTFDSYPYIYGSTRLIILFPDWAHDGGPERLKEVLRSQEGRERLRLETGPRAPSWQDMWLTYFKRPENHKYEGVVHRGGGRGDGQASSGRHMRHLAGGGLADQLRGRGGFRQHPARLRHPPSVHGGERRPPPGRLPQPPYLRLLPHNPGGVREGGEADVSAVCDTKDDILSGPAAGDTGQRSTPGWHEGGHHGVPSQEHSRHHHTHEPQAVPHRNRVRYRQRRGRRGPGQPHRSAGRTSAEARASVDLAALWPCLTPLNREDDAGRAVGVVVDGLLRDLVATLQP